MLEKQKQPEACIVIYDILQGNVATRFSAGRTSDYDFIIGSQPSDHIFVVSVCLSVCLFVQSFSQLSPIRFGSN